MLEIKERLHFIATVYLREKVIEQTDVKQRMHYHFFLQSMQVLSIRRALYSGLVLVT